MSSQPSPHPLSLVSGTPCGQNTVVVGTVKLGPNKTQCSICGSTVLKASLNRHQISLKCRAAQKIQELKRRGMVTVDPATESLLHASGVKVERHYTRYVPAYRRIHVFQQPWVPRIAQIIGYNVRIYCRAVTRNRRKVVQDLLGNAAAKVAMELGADPRPFIQEAAERLLGLKFWNLKKEQMEDADAQGQ